MKIRVQENEPWRAIRKWQKATIVVLGGNTEKTILRDMSSREVRCKFWLSNSCVCSVSIRAILIASCLVLLFGSSLALWWQWPDLNYTTKSRFKIKCFGYTASSCSDDLDTLTQSPVHYIFYVLQSLSDFRLFIQRYERGPDRINNQCAYTAVL